MSTETCGGCRGLGKHSPRCVTQPGAMWLRYADIAESLGDRIGPNDKECSALAWRLAVMLRNRWSNERADRETT